MTTILFKGAICGAIGGLIFLLVWLLLSPESIPSGKNLISSKSISRLDPIEIFIQTKVNFPKEDISVLAKDIRACSKISQISPATILALIEVESEFDPNAVNKTTGALGLMQVNPGVFSDAERGFISGCEKLIFFNVRENGNLYKTLISYNAGSVRKRIGKNKIPGQDFAVQILKRATEIESQRNLNVVGRRDFD